MTRLMAAAGSPPPAASITAAAEALAEGDIVGLPTDTVYGLAADPWHSGAADRLFLIKGRPRSMELPVLVSGIEQALALTTAVTGPARKMMAELWPGPLTIVLPRAAEVDADLGDEDATIGVRCPAHPVALALCREFGPYAATSANRHGSPPATTAADLASDLPGVGLVLDGGVCRAEPSTVVDATGEVVKLLRAGGVAWEKVRAVAGG